MTKSASAEIDEKLRSLGDWRGAMLAKLRRLIREADPASRGNGEVAKAVEPAWRPGVGA